MLMIGEKELCFPKNGHKMKKIRVECDCDHPQHYVEFSWFVNSDKTPPFDGGELYVSVGMRKLPWHKRLRHGIKYILGHVSDFSGPYEEALFRDEDIEKLIQELQRAKKDIDEENELLMKSIRDEKSKPK